MLPHGVGVRSLRSGLSHKVPGPFWRKGRRKTQSAVNQTSPFMNFSMKLVSAVPAANVSFSMIAY